MHMHKPICALSRPCKTIMRYLLAIGCLLVFFSSPAHAGVVQGEVISVERGYVRIGVGAEAGLKVGDQGRVYYTVLVGHEGRPRFIYVASVTVTSVDQKSSVAKVEQAQGEIMAGYLVEISRGEAPPRETQQGESPQGETPVVQAPTELVRGEEKPPPAKAVKKKKAGKRSVKPGEVWRDPHLGMSFVWVPDGCFEMGCGDRADGCSDSEKPPHKVCLNGFWMGRHEVTQQQWRQLMGTNPSDFKRCGSQCPVEEVSWNEALEFARKLSSKTGYIFRLPSEAEWEYACRSGGKKQMYAGGDAVDAVAWYEENSDGSPQHVGRKRPNDLGIFDMSGNVCEWCLDIFEKDAYLKAKITSGNSVFIGDTYADIYGEGYSRILSLLVGASGHRSVRGGSWGNAADRLRCTDRIKGKPGSSRDWLGFRLVREEIKKK